MKTFLSIPGSLQFLNKNFSKNLSAILVILCSITITPTIAKPVFAQTQPIKLQTSANPQVAQKLLGQWQAKNPEGKETFQFMFTPEGNLFGLIPENPNIAIPFKYQINPTGKPMHIDITLPDGEIVQTIFEFTPDGKMRLQIEDTEPGKTRPKAFTSKVTVFEKLSDTSKLPENVKILGQSEENQQS